MRPADQPRALRVAAELGFFQEDRMLRDSEHQPGSGPTEYCQQLVEAFFRAGPHHINEDDPVISVVKTAIKLPPGITAGCYPNESSVRFGEHAGELFELLSGLFEADRHGERRLEGIESQDRIRVSRQEGRFADVDAGGTRVQCGAKCIHVLSP